MATGGGPANATRRVLAFRQSPKTHFRKRCGVADHARALGMTPDRPHDLSVRLLGKPTTLDQIAAALGFPHTDHFSRFFRRIEGVPPCAANRATPTGPEPQPKAS
jgi:AraC family transcriptional regulator, transcriptional activator of pobA